MSDFKVGDKVIYTPRHNAAWHDRDGEQGEVVRINGDPLYYVRFNDGIEKFCHERNLDLVKDEIQEGQIYVSNEGSREFKILAVTGELVALSDDNDFDTLDYWRTKDAFKSVFLDNGAWHLKTAADEVKEVTLDEIAAKFNVSADKIRVKKEI